MWISEALMSPPRGMYWVLVSSWVRSFFLAAGAVATGWALDAALGDAAGIPGAPAWGIAQSLLVAAAATVIGSLGAYAAEAMPPKLAAEQEMLWRGHMMGRVLHPDFRVSVAASKGSGKVGHRSGHGGSRTGDGSRHPVGKRDRAGDEGILFNAATTSVEQTAKYRATFLAPTLASFSGPLIILLVWAVFVDAATAVWLALFFIAAPLIIIGAGKVLRRSNASYRRKQAKATNGYLEMLEGLGTYKVLGAIDRVLADFGRQTRATMRELTELLAHNQLMIIVNDAVFGVVMSTTAIGLVLLRLQSGAVSPGTALAGILLSVLLYEPVNRVGRTFYIGLGGRTHRNGIVELVGDPEHVGAPELGGDLTLGDNGAEASFETGTDSSVPTSTTLTAAAPEIAIEGLNVDIDGKRILNDVDLTIAAGTKVGIVGPSGSGKSTLLRVLAGLQPFTGTITIDGTVCTRAALLHSATLISQNPGVFGSTIRENLLIARPEATDEELRSALREVQLLDEVLARPGGLDSLVGDRGNWLSGGQRRRLTIARGLLNFSPLVLLDEPTADIDRRTESLIHAALGRLSAGKTCIMVAHRLETLADVDQVIVVAGGRVIAQGSPAELRQLDGFFAHAVAADASGRKDTIGADGKDR